MNPLVSRRKQLREEIDGEEQQLRRSIDQLRGSLRATVSVGARAAKRPYGALGIALALGFALGSLPHD